MTCEEMKELQVQSCLDGSMEKSLFFCPEDAADTPLLVGLHTWSADRFNQVKTMLPLCRKLGWALLLPEFRGPNLDTNPRAPEACASDAARQDIMDAAEFVLERYPLDRSAVFLLGGSGGGHMSLMMSAYAPTFWRAVSSWCPITDLTAWHGQNPGYAPHIAACCGGRPGDSARVDEAYRLRSPMSWLKEISQATLFVHHGRFDPAVPFSHTFNLICGIEAIGSQSFFYEVFNGAHEMHADRAVSWFNSLLDADRAQPAALTR